MSCSQKHACKERLSWIIQGWFQWVLSIVQLQMPWKGSTCSNWTIEEMFLNLLCYLLWKNHLNKLLEMCISLIFLLHILHFLPYCLFLLSVCCSVCFSASVCPAGTHGLMCSDHCKCENHGECHPVTGQCTCFPGFHGRFCEKGNLFFSSTVFYIVSWEEKLVIWPRNVFSSNTIQTEIQNYD